jgi:hypothetical protein
MNSPEVSIPKLNGITSNNKILSKISDLFLFKIAP